MQTDPYNNDFIAREKSGEPIHSVTKRYLLEGRLYRLDEILGSSAFMEADFTVTYIQAGSFVRFLMDVYGIESLKALFRTLNSGDRPDASKTAFLSVYGKNLEAVEEEWLAFLRAY